MEQIISPLDNIINVVHDLQKTGNNTRRGSTQEDKFENILGNINTAKNNIIMYFSDIINNRPPQPSPLPPKAEIKSYANVVQPQRTANKLIIPVSKITPNTDEIAKTEQRLVDIIKKSNIPATVIKTSATDRGNIVFNFHKDDNIDSIKEPLTKEFGNIKMKKAISPKIKIIGVPSYFNTNDKKEVIDHIIENNSFIKSLTKAEQDTLEFLFSYDIKNHKSLVLKCSPTVRAAIFNNKDKIKVGLSLCRAYDRIHVLQCSKCCRFGHNYRNCKVETFTCAHCSENHKSSDCPTKNSSESYRCINCSLSNEDAYKKSASHHNAFSTTCPLYAKERKLIISRTDFGIDQKL